MSDKICYCFNYTEADIRADVMKNGGESTILAKIVMEKRQGACECTTYHPERR